MIDILMILGGLVLLFFGGEGLIKGAVSLAYNFGLSKLLVSAVIVGFGTSMPEMTVSIGAALKGSSDIALGNVVGSNIANILLILGVGSVLYPLAIPASNVRRDTLMMIGASLILCGLSFIGVINFIAGLFLFAILCGYIFWSYKEDKKEQSDLADHIHEDLEGGEHIKPLVATIFSIGGLIMLVGGAYLMVEGATAIARDFGISEAVIGLTIVAVGTSLPELATSILAALRKHGDIIIGNVLGSNIFNILSILGITALVSPVSIASQIADSDIWVMLGTAIFISIYLLRGYTIGRLSGIAMLVAYGGYTYWLYAEAAMAQVL